MLHAGEGGYTDAVHAQGNLPEAVASNGNVHEATPSSQHSRKAVQTQILDKVLEELVIHSRPEVSTLAALRSPSRAASTLMPSWHCY